MELVSKVAGITRFDVGLNTIGSESQRRLHEEQSGKAAKNRSEGGGNAEAGVGTPPYALNPARSFHRPKPQLFH